MGDRLEADTGKLEGSSAISHTLPHTSATSRDDCRSWGWTASGNRGYLERHAAGSGSDGRTALHSEIECRQRDHEADQAGKIDPGDRISQLEVAPGTHDAEQNEHKCQDRRLHNVFACRAVSRRTISQGHRQHVRRCLWSKWFAVTGLTAGYQSPTIPSP